MCGKDGKTYLNQCLAQCLGGLGDGKDDKHKVNSYSPNLFIECLTQNVMFHVKSHITKHVFWGLSIIESQHPIKPNLTRNIFKKIRW